MKKSLFVSTLAVFATSLLLFGCSTPSGPSTTEKVLSATKISNGVTESEMKMFMNLAKDNDLTESELKNCLILMKKAGLDTSSVVAEFGNGIILKAKADEYICPSISAVNNMTNKALLGKECEYTHILKVVIGKDKEGNKVLSQLNLIGGVYVVNPKRSNISIYSDNEVKHNLSKFTLTKKGYEELSKKASKVAVNELEDVEKGIDNVKVRYVEAVPYVNVNMISKDEFFYKVLVELEFDKKAFAGSQKRVVYADDFLFDENFKYTGRKDKDKKFNKGSEKERIDSLIKSLKSSAKKSQVLSNSDAVSSSTNAKVQVNNITRQTLRTTGVILGNDVNVRKGPSTDYKRLGVFFKGDKVRVVEKTFDGNHIWYKIEFDNPNYGLITGYVRSDFIKVN